MAKLKSKLLMLLNLIKTGKYPELLESVLINMEKIGVSLQIKELVITGVPVRKTITPLPDFFIRRIELSEVSLLTPFEDKDTTVFERRIKEYGDDCMGLFFRGDMVGYGWISRTMMRIPELEYERPLKENEIYLYDGVIRKDMRRKGFWLSFLEWLVQETTRNNQTILGYIDITNYKSKKVHFDMGFQSAGTVALLKLGNLWKHRFIKSIPGITNPMTYTTPSN